MQLSADEISQIIKKQIQNFDRAALVAETGTVLTSGDGIARIYGLEGAMAGELVEFPGDLFGLVLNLEQDSVGVAILGDATGVKEGDTVKRTGRIADVPVGEAVVGPCGQRAGAAHRRQGAHRQQGARAASRSRRRASSPASRSRSRCRRGSRPSTR